MMSARAGETADAGTGAPGAGAPDGVAPDAGAPDDVAPDADAPVMWVALLRGVNVGGNTVRSADLAAAFEGLGFTRVRTVLASGNVVFGDQHGRDATTLRRVIEARLDERFGYGLRCLVISAAELAGVVGRYPFEEVDARHPYVVFASDPAVLQAMMDAAPEAARQAAGERLALADGVLFWEVPKGSSTDTPFARESAKAAYRRGDTVVTTRNLRTLRRLAP